MNLTSMRRSERPAPRRRVASNETGAGRAGVRCPVTPQARTSIRSKARGESRQITFEVITKTPLPVGEQVFVTGNHDLIGNWEPDGFPLTRTDDNVWSGSAVFPAGQTIEYKITRGSWKSEETGEDGTVPAANKTVRKLTFLLAIIGCLLHGVFCVHS